MKSKFYLLIISFLLLNACLDNGGSSNDISNNKKDDTHNNPIGVADDRILSIDDNTDNFLLKESSLMNLDISLDKSELANNVNDAKFVITTKIFDQNDTEIKDHLVEVSKLELIKGQAENGKITVNTFSKPLRGKIIFYVNDVKQQQNLQFTLADRKIEFSKPEEVLINGQVTGSVTLKYISDLSPAIVSNKEKIRFKIDHDTGITINSGDICEFNFSNPSECTIKYTIQKSELQNGANNLKVGDTDIMKESFNVKNNESLTNSADFNVYVCPGENELAFTEPKYIITRDEIIYPKLISCINPDKYKNPKVKIEQDAKDINDPLKNHLLLQIKDPIFDLTLGKSIGKSAISFVAPILEFSTGSTYITATVSSDDGPTEIKASTEVAQNSDKPLIYYFPLSLNGLSIDQNGGSGSFLIEARFWNKIGSKPTSIEFADTPGVIISPKIIKIPEDLSSDGLVQVKITSDPAMREDNIIKKQISFKPNADVFLPDNPLNVRLMPVHNSYAPLYVNKIFGTQKHFYLTVHNEEQNPVKSPIYVTKADGIDNSSISATMLQDPNKKSSTKLDCSLNSGGNHCSCTAKKCVFYVHVKNMPSWLHSSIDLLTIDYPEGDSDYLELKKIMSTGSDLQTRADLQFNFCKGSNYNFIKDKISVDLNQLVSNTIDSDPDAIVDPSDIVAQTSAAGTGCVKLVIDNYDKQTVLSKGSDFSYKVDNLPLEMSVTKITGKQEQDVVCQMKGLDLVNYKSDSIDCVAKNAVVLPFRIQANNTTVDNVYNFSVQDN